MDVLQPESNQSGRKDSLIVIFHEPKFVRCTGRDSNSTRSEYMLSDCSQRAGEDLFLSCQVISDEVLELLHEAVGGRDGYDRRQVYILAFSAGSI